MLICEVEATLGHLYFVSETYVAIHTFKINWVQAVFL